MIIIAKGYLAEGDLGRVIILLAVIAFAARMLRAPLPAATWFPAAVSALYLLGLSAVYLMTPRDLRWHLMTSVDHTALVAITGLLASCFLALEAIETSSGVPRPLQRQR